MEKTSDAFRNISQALVTLYLGTNLPAFVIMMFECVGRQAGVRAREIGRLPLLAS